MNDVPFSMIPIDDSIGQVDSQQVRSTKKRGRSTTGCANCKIRKIKCDERKPGCSRCHHKRLKCPGYTSNTLRWSLKHEMHQRSSPNILAKPRPTFVTDDVLQPQTATNFAHPNSMDEALGSLSHVPSCYGDYGSLEAHIIDSFETEEPFALADGFVIENNLQHDNLPTGSHAASSITKSVTNHATQIETSALAIHRNADNLTPQTWNQYSVAVEINCCPHVPEDSLRSSTRQDQSLNTRGPSCELPTSDAVESSRGASERHLDTSLYPSLLHVPTVLIEYYFHTVCRDCSTFDSPLNPFRSMIAKMQLNSACVNHVIQSLAATKLANEMPRMKVTGIEAQGKALQSLKTEVLTKTSLQNVSNEALSTILLLGMTTSWHIREDLGVQYLALAWRIVEAKTRSQDDAAKSGLEFYLDALKYWTMIVSLVSGEVVNFVGDEGDFPACLEHQSHLPKGLAAQRVMPHPWTGVSPASQHLFGQVLRLIRKTRSGVHERSLSKYSRADVVSISRAINEAEVLETQCWSTTIPSIGDVENTSDPSTPAVDHVLTAKAYLLSALLHIYTIFPDVLSSRMEQVAQSDVLNPFSEVGMNDPGEAHVITPAYLWSRRSIDDPQDMWLRDVGFRIVECLQTIDVKSGTRVVHPPLLLSVASALTMPDSVLRVSDISAMEGLVSSGLQDLQHHDATHRRSTVSESNLRILQSRAFIVSRLEIMHALIRFNAIQSVLQIIKEVWRRADTGFQSYFWMDVMHELRCETLFG